jgi:hypothetical protein
LGDDVIFAPLDLMAFPSGDDVCLGISGLESAARFWASFDPARLPDIVIGDVDFEIDKTSPLQSWKATEQNIPTGLSHLKPLAAVARAVGKPLSIVIHTADPYRWEVFAANSGGTRPDARVFGLMAAHEAVELAAILGEHIPRVDRHDLNPVWGWLESRTESTPMAVLPKAVTTYRKQVVERLRRSGSGSDPLALRVPLGARAELQAWCQRMAHDPAPLEDAGIDVGLPLLYPDGRIDRINFSSLYADVYNINGRILHADCFALTNDSGPIWELANGLPRIGALVAAIGGVEEAASAAAGALTLLPLGEDRLTQNLRDIEEDPLARGLAVLFRTIAIYREDESAWARIWDEGSWDPVCLAEKPEDSRDSRSDSLIRRTRQTLQLWKGENRNFCRKLSQVLNDAVNEFRLYDKTDERDDCSWADSLESWVDRTEQAVRMAAKDEAPGIDEEATQNGALEGFVDLGSITAALIQGVKSDGYPDLTGLLEPSAVAFHLDLLVQMDLVEYRSDPINGDTYRVADAPGRGLRPVRPAEDKSGLKWISDHLSAALRDSLGFGATRGPGNANSDNAIGLILYAAFLAPANPTAPLPATSVQAQQGRDFLKTFEAGESPGWLVEICRAFCRDKLHWVDERAWPVCVRGH